ncbi:MAG TPA: hypothetical protein VFH68_27250 [Polyangia bacterium]|jgi:hypothetical protein|nr:hypothetical protein [Polyangia bacterium]
MSPAVVLAIVIATHDVDDRATEAMRATAAEALGSEEAVAVRDVEAPSDGEALRIERAIRAQAVAQVVWLDVAHTRARLRVHAVKTGRWIERTITFSNVDTAVERGRALGFALTSMLPEETLAANPHRRPEGPPVISKTAEGDFGTSLRLGAVGSLGLGGTATGIGGHVAGEFYLTSSWLLRLSFEGRWGGVRLAREDDPTTQDVDEKLGPFDQTAIAGYGGLGVGYWPFRRTPGRWWTAGVRADALVLFHSIYGPSVTDGKPDFSRNNKFMPGLDAAGEVGLVISDSAEILTSLGLEAAFGPTPLLLGPRGDETVVGHIAILRAVAEIGFRLSF